MGIPRNKAAKKNKRKTRTPAQGTSVTPSSPTPKVWQPGDGLESGEELNFDSSAYDYLIRFRDTWPSLSFDLIPELDPPTSSPYSIQLISGTQGAKPRENYVVLTRVRGITKLAQESSSEDDDDEEDEVVGDKTSASELIQQRLRHHGAINRIRRMPQDERFVALFDDRSIVEILDVTNAIHELRSGHTSNQLKCASVLYSHKHSTEGFALDWSPVKQALLASGDCANQLLIWHPNEGGNWAIQECSNGHRESVEDIQWSPVEESVFASCSVDKTVKIWDARDSTGSRISVEASVTDVNVISWSASVDYMLASGDDNGVLRIWDLRKFQSSESIAEFEFHKKAITSVEWSPHESSMLCTASEDNQIAVWDLALERDVEEEAQFANKMNATLQTSIPPQLLFLHGGQNAIKELHWHLQIPGFIVSTAMDGMNLFKASNCKRYWSSCFDVLFSLKELNIPVVYGVAFNHFRKNEKIFATVGGNRASIYRCEDNGDFSFLQCYVDDDKDEEFYVCRWGLLPSSDLSVLILAGKNGVVRVVDTRHATLINTLVGHGQCINDLRVFPTRPHLLITASKDESARIWNLQTGVTVFIVSGDGGHTAEVLSVDGHLDGEQFLTSGMDNFVRIWTIKNYQDLVEKSEGWDSSKERRNFPTVHLQYPVFSTKNVHSNYVDCVQWYGDLIISKGADERIVIFKALELPSDVYSTSEKFTTLIELNLDNCELWYVRFSLDFEYQILACGDQQGKVHVWDIHNPYYIRHSLLEDNDCNFVIRQTAVSTDGSTILAACDEGDVWRWDRKSETYNPL
eukprot:g3998.t1